MSSNRVGILTGGGDCPGLNAVIRAAVIRGTEIHGFEFVGILDGWKGLVDSRYTKLNLNKVVAINNLGGTILGTSRTNIFKTDDLANKAIENLRKLDLRALIAIGGEDTLSVASKLSALGFSVIGVPKTIDNDLPETDFTFGFDTAVEVATSALDRLRTTAESHHRVIVCEVMGRNAGFIALWSGVASGAEIVLIPEKPFSIGEIAKKIKKMHSSKHFSSIIVVAEGSTATDLERASTDELDSFGHPKLTGIGELIASEVQRLTGIETRTTILGHIQRGGTPTARDRFLSTNFGYEAVDAIAESQFGIMVALKGTKFVRVPFSKIQGKTKRVSLKEYDKLVEKMLLDC